MKLVCTKRKTGKVKQRKREKKQKRKYRAKWDRVKTAKSCVDFKWHSRVAGEERFGRRLLGKRVEKNLTRVDEGKWKWI